MGKEVERSMGEFGDQVMKMQSDARTLKAFRERPQIMGEYLAKEHERARIRLKERNFLNSLMEIEEIGSMQSGDKKRKQQFGAKKGLGES